jgi:predicted ABC-type ATPase
MNIYDILKKPVNSVSPLNALPTPAVSPLPTPIAKPSMLSSLALPLPPKITSSITPPVRPLAMTPLKAIASPLPGKITSIVSKPINETSPKTNMFLEAATGIRDAANKTVKNFTIEDKPPIDMDWVDVANIIPTLAGQFIVSPIVSAGLSLGRVAQDKLKEQGVDNAFTRANIDEVNIPAFGKDQIEESFGKKGGSIIRKERGNFIDAKSSQKIFEEQIAAGVPEEKAFWLTAIKTVGDMAALVPLAQGLTKATVRAVRPDSLITPEILSANREMIRDFITGRRASIDLDIPQPLKEAITETLKTGTREEKIRMLKGIDILQAKPSQVGKLLGISQDEADQLLTELYGGPVRPTAQAQLPGRVDSGEGGFIKNPMKDQYPGEQELTSKVLDKLEGRTSVSKQFIADLTNNPDMKQAERELVRAVLNEYADDKDVPVKEFAEKVQSELLPLKRKDGIEADGFFDGERDQSSYRYENIVLPDDVRGNVANYSEHIYESPIKTSAGDVHFSNEPNYFAHARVEDLSSENFAEYSKRTGLNTGSIMPGAKLGTTRRVIEIQSDLFQKGRLEGEMATGRPKNVDVEARWDELNRRKQQIETAENPAAYSDELAKVQVEMKDIKNAVSPDFKGFAEKRGAEISKLEPYRNTWQNRIISEEVRQAAKDGKTKLQFPTGETAMKIEGLGGAFTRWAAVRPNGSFNMHTGPLLPETMKVGMQVHDGTSKWIITDVLGDGKFKAVPKDFYEQINKGKRIEQVKPNNKWVAETPGGVKEAFDSKEEAQKWLMGTRTESFDISGKVDTNNPIYRFYEKEVGRYLQRFGAKRITDPQGVSWYEVNITPDMAKRPVGAFGDLGSNVERTQRASDSQKGFARNPFAKAEPAKETYLIETPGRIKLRDTIATALYGKGAKNKNRRVDILIGLPAAGKSTIAEDLLKEHGALLVDADKAKEMLPEWKGGKGSTEVHVEGSRIAQRQVLPRAMEAGDNIVFPTLGRFEDKLKAKIDGFTETGYEVHLHYVDVPYTVAKQRAKDRFDRGGQFVPDDLTSPETELDIRNNYDKFKIYEGVQTSRQIKNQSNESPSSSGSREDIPSRSQGQRVRDGEGSDESIKYEPTAELEKKAREIRMFDGRTPDGLRIPRFNVNSIDEANQEYLQTLSKQESGVSKTAAETVEAIKKPEETKAHIDSLKLENIIAKEELLLDPARQLSKYANKRTGELPEVTGDGKSIFARKGDDIVTELGFKDSEQAREAYQKYLERRSKALKGRESMNELVGDYRNKKAVIEAVTKKLRAEGRGRKMKIDDIQEFFHLTDKEMATVVKGSPDYRLISESEFQNLLKGLEGKAYDAFLRSEATAKLEWTIFDKELVKLDNLRRALKLPEIKNMSRAQLEEFNTLLETFKAGDEFLGVRQIQTLKNTDLAGAKTKREVLEDLAKRTNMPLEAMTDIKIGTFDRYLYDVALARKSPFHKVMVEDTSKALAAANVRFYGFKRALNDLMIKARASRSRSLADRAIPTDEMIFDWLSSDSATKLEYTKRMTPEELDAARFIQSRYAEVRDYLIAKGQLDRFRTNYITNIQRPFLEDVSRGVTGGILDAFKGLLDDYKQQEAYFTILNQKTGQVLPLEKFFRFALRRSGEVTPTKNVSKAVLSYMSAFEKKVALDSIVPKIDVYASSITPSGMTKRGLELDDSVKRFVREWLNTKRGRVADTLFVTPGGAIDWSIRKLIAFVRILDLGLNIPVGISANVGEQVMTVANIGVKKTALGAARALTPQGKKIARKYSGFVGERLLDKMRDTSSDIGDKLGEGLFSLFSAASRRANIEHLLGSMTKEEFNAGAISDERLGELRLEIGKYRVIEQGESVLGKTALGKAFTMYKSWAVGTLHSTIHNLNTLAKMSLRGENAFKSREFQELFRVTAMAAFIGFTTYSYYDELKDKKNRSFTEQLAFKSMTDGLSLLGALNPSLWSTPARIQSFINDLLTAATNVSISLATGERTQKDKEIVGLSKLQSTLTPALVRSLTSLNIKNLSIPNPALSGIKLKQKDSAIKIDMKKNPALQGIKLVPKDKDLSKKMLK